MPRHNTKTLAVVVDNGPTATLFAEIGRPIVRNNVASALREAVKRNMHVLNTGAQRARQILAKHGLGGPTMA